MQDIVITKFTSEKKLNNKNSGFSKKNPDNLSLVPNPGEPPRCSDALLWKGPGLSQLASSPLN